MCRRISSFVFARPLFYENKAFFCAHKWGSLSCNALEELCDKNEQHNSVSSFIPSPLIPFIQKTSNTSQCTWYLCSQRQAVILVKRCRSETNFTQAFLAGTVADRYVINSSSIEIQRLVGCNPSLIWKFYWNEAISCYNRLLMGRINSLYIPSRIQILHHTRLPRNNNTIHSSSGQCCLRSVRLQPSRFLSGMPTKKSNISGLWHFGHCTRCKSKFIFGTSLIH